jgi:hypothetical protein
VAARVGHGSLDGDPHERITILNVMAMIVLFTDFGLHGPYTGQMKAVLHASAICRPERRSGMRTRTGLPRSPSIRAAQTATLIFRSARRSRSSLE